MATITIPTPWHVDGISRLTTWLWRLRSALQRVQQALCALTGHEFMIHREPGRLCLECTHCGRRTRGWAIAPPVSRHATRPVAPLRRGGERAA
ncbi:MAG: hypothetical protein ACRD3G_04590 [Vicinamibacterales bacterium]